MGPISVENGDLSGIPVSAIRQMIGPGIRHAHPQQHAVLRLYDTTISLGGLRLSPRLTDGLIIIRFLIFPFAFCPLACFSFECFVKLSWLVLKDTLKSTQPVHALFQLLVANQQYLPILICKNHTAPSYMTLLQIYIARHHDATHQH